MVTALAMSLLLSAEPLPRVQVSLQAPPVVLMVRAGTSQAQQRRERKLYDELAVALDGFMLMSQDADREGFERLPLSEQIAAVLPVAQGNGASIVVWLGFPLPNQVMLHLIALGSGRALVRTIESDRSSVAESSLALMARELLGTAYLFEPPKSVPLEVQAVVTTVKQQIGVAAAPPPPPTVVEPPPPPPPTPGHWALWGRLESGYGLVGHVDASPSLGLSALLERRFPFRIDAAVLVAGSYGAISRSDLTSSVWMLGGGVTAYRGFGDGIVSAGPTLSATLHFARFQAAAVPLSTALPRFSAGAQARVDIAKGPAVSALLSIDYLPLRPELRSAENQVLFRSPTLELHLAIGVGWQGL
jgi:hypothetical protein